VREEVAATLQRGIPVIPVRVGSEEQMPITVTVYLMIVSS
jgi:hypothetical protein